MTQAPSTAPDLIVQAAALRAVRLGITEAASLPPGDVRITSLLGLCQRVLDRLPEGSIVPAASSRKLSAPPLTLEQVQEYLDRRFPACHLQVRQYTDVPGGRSKLTSLLTLADNPHLPSELVLRRDNPGSAQNTSVRDEFPVLQAVWTAGVIAPQVLWLEADANALGAPFLVMRRSLGTAPGDYWSSAAVPRSVCLQLADALAKLHGVDVRLAWPQADRSGQHCVRDMLDIFLGRLPSPADHAGNHAGDALRRGYQWAYRELRCMDGASVPVHGDVHFGNTLADAEQLHCLIDWEFAHAGHAAEDLAFCRGHVERIVPWSEFMNRYLAAGGRPVSDAQLQYFQVWSYLRNLTLATSVLEDIRAGKVNDLQNMVIALDARPRLETLLLQALPSG